MQSALFFSFRNGDYGEVILAEETTNFSAVLLSSVQRKFSQDFNIMLYSGSIPNEVYPRCNYC